MSDEFELQTLNKIIPDPAYNLLRTWPGTVGWWAAALSAMQDAQAPAV